MRPLWTSVETSLGLSGGRRGSPLQFCRHSMGVVMEGHLRRVRAAWGHCRDPTGVLRDLFATDVGTIWVSRGNSMGTLLGLVGYRYCMVWGFNRNSRGSSWQPHGDTCLILREPDMDLVELQVNLRSNICALSVCLRWSRCEPRENPVQPCAIPS